MLVFWCVCECLFHDVCGCWFHGWLCAWLWWLWAVVASLDPLRLTTTTTGPPISLDASPPGPPSARPSSARPPSAGPPKISRSPLQHHFRSRLKILSRQALQATEGFHTTAREPKRVHFRVPTFKNTTKIPRQDTKREKKYTARPPEREKKSENGRGRRIKGAKF